MEDNFDPKEFSLDPTKVETHNKKAKSIYQTKEGELFLRGPMPLWWINEAAKKPGRAFHVGVRLWFLAGLVNSTQVKLNQSDLLMMGISRDAARRGLLALEGAGLVAVDRGAGRCPVVTLRIHPQNSESKKVIGKETRIDV